MANIDLAVFGQLTAVPTLLPTSLATVSSRLFILHGDIVGCHRRREVQHLGIGGNSSRLHQHHRADAFARSLVVHPTSTCLRLPRFYVALINPHQKIPVKCQVRGSVYGMCMQECSMAHVRCDMAVLLTPPRTHFTARSTVVRLMFIMYVSK